MTRAYQVCNHCVMDTTDSKIVFDEKGVCDHCRNFYENIRPNWHPDERGARELSAILEKIKADGAGKKYDCLIGLSGGVDSSYVAYMAVKKWGLRPLIFTVDTGWNLPVAVENCNKIISALGADVHPVTPDFDEMKDLQRAYFLSQVPYQDTPQDHVIFASLYNFAARNGFKYILTGGNYATECVREPVEWVHQNDIRQIRDIHGRFGTRPLATLPLCGMFKYRLYYRYAKGIRVVKPLDLIPYAKADAIETLKREFVWTLYKNKHYESVFTRFYEGWWLIRKFGYDKRRAHFSSLILTGQLEREEALKILGEPPYPEEEAMADLELIAGKLGWTKTEFLDIMSRPNKTYRDYKSSLPLINAAVRLARAVGVERRNFR